jgi:hypothetical protein
LRRGLGHPADQLADDGEPAPLHFGFDAANLCSLNACITFRSGGSELGLRRLRGSGDHQHPDDPGRMKPASALSKILLTMNPTADVTV